MKKGALLYLSIAIVILIIPIILADVDMKIKTLPDYKISVFIRNVGELSTLESFHQNTGDGNVVISSDIALEEVDLLVILKKDGIEMLNKKFSEVPTSKIININFIPGDAKIVESFEEKKNETSNETNVSANVSSSEISNETEKEGIKESKEKTEEISVTEIKEPLITGKAIEDVKNVIFSKTTYYIIGVIVIVGVLVFLIYLRRKKLPIGFKTIKYSEYSKKQDHDKRLDDAEKKLDSARRELDEIKSREVRLRETRERFRKDQKELAKLEKGF